jgi:MFS family permease
MSVQLLAPAAVRPLVTDVPARLDRLPWTRFHWFLVTALGVTWVLDGLEVTVVSAVGNVLLEPQTLGLERTQLGLSQTGYMIGAIVGALGFGHLTDRLGRKRLFTVTLVVYMAGAAVTATAVGFPWFFLGRLITGLAIGGEYAAINSAIDELIPARVRGRVDLAVNGTFWLGAILGAGVSVVLLDPNFVPTHVGWRVAFGLGSVAALAMIVARRFVPESPRWLLTHGRGAEAETIIAEIERRAGQLPPAEHLPTVTIYPGRRVGLADIARTLFVRYPSRAVLGLVLIASQAFFYNGLLFSFPLALEQYFHVRADRVGLFIVAMSAANLLGPMLLGHLFDTVGRRRMISGTYALSGLILAGAALLFVRGELTAATQTALWAATFFFASAAASAGYLTVSEVFPLEMRALAIALFYALGTAIGGATGPVLFGYLLEHGGAGGLAGGYLFGAVLMIAAAGTEWGLGVDAEQKSLEDIASPLTSEGA